MDSQPDQVVLVDGSGDPNGVMDKVAAHTAPGYRHLAFSVVAFDRHGRILLQRRNPAKPTFGDHWANTCCSHPRPDETVIEAATRRVRQELGVELIDAVELGRFEYRAEDHSTGMVESELDVVVTGTLIGTIEPDPSEVAEVRWFTRTELEAASLREAPWLDGVLETIGWR
jgi:isopentenyl-diphosphate delta-isomerase